MLKTSDEDRLSELPESLILHILSFLETRNSVKTSLLSKQWANLWTTLPFLEFTEKNIANLTFIYQALRRWRGTQILRFKIDLSSSNAMDAASFSCHMDSWLRFATGMKLESLDLRLPFNSRQLPASLYRPPPCLYSCSSITKLHLHGFGLEGIMRVQWYNLKSLHLVGLSFGEDMINHVLSSAPKLQVLILQCRSRDNLSIRSSSLQYLSIVNNYNSCSRVYDPLRYRKLTIWTPKLKVLRIAGNAYKECLLMEVSSVIQVCLCFNEFLDSEEFRDTLMQILPKIQHVKALTLSPCSLKMLEVMMKGTYSCLPFSNVKRLEFSGGPIKPNEIVGLVAEIFPKVETLQIDWKLDCWYPLFLFKLSEMNVDGNDKAIKNNLEVLMQLKRVEFTWHSYENLSMFVLIGFLLKHAAMVQEIVIRRGGSTDVAAEEQFQVLCSQQIFPTKDVSITFLDSKITIRRREGILIN